ncbi:flippase-like domain-containing protein [Saprospiraceae bacterium]|nr:flippase-like domain-containing protein [Saprospiraceae bacterium]
MNKDILKSLVGVLIGAVLMYFTLKNQDIGETITNLKSANPLWIAVSGIILGFVFIFRALRWNVMLDNIGYKIKNTHILYYTLYGYLINSFTPKFGEVLRCTALAKDADIPVPASLGSVIMERVYDIVVLLIGLTIVGLLEIDRLGHLFTEASAFVGEQFEGSGTKLIIAGVVGVIALVIGVFILKKIQLFAKVKTFVDELMQSVLSSIKMKRFPIFLLHTIIIWLLLILLNYVFLLAIPDTQDLNIYFAVVILFVGAIGWALPSPNGIGTTHFIILQLFLVFGLSEAGAVTFGLLSNGLILIFTILYGLIAIAIKAFGGKWEPVRE